MQWIVVDLGANTEPAHMAWVLDACNGAVSNGRCVSDAPVADAGPEAVAIVRVRDVSGQVVRIEVGRRRNERDLWSVRELEFSSEDPPEERWQSVGLALATLVGEIEKAESQAEAAAVTENSGAPEVAEPSVPARTSNAVESAAPGPDAGVTEALEEPLVRPGAFVGIGALLGQGSETNPVRWGAGARFAWAFGTGLQLSCSADYSRLTAEPGLDLDWLRLTAGAGYRYFAADRMSIGLSARVGVRVLGIDAADAEGRRSERSWSPLGAGALDAYWQLVSWGGLWAEVELASIGRQTRLLDRDLAPESVLPFGDATGVLGLWLAP